MKDNEALNSLKTAPKTLVQCQGVGVSSVRAAQANAPARRAVMAGLLGTGAGAMGLAGLMPETAWAQTSDRHNAKERGLNPLTWLNRDRDRFEVVYGASTGVVAARMRDFSIPTPDGTVCQARLAYPVTVFDRMPLILFCPDAGCTGAMYDPFIGALAASGYFVIALNDGRANGDQVPENTSGAPAQGVQRQSLAEARFMIDMAGEAAKVLGTRADRVDASRVGVAGHGQGAWMALSLAGWGSSNAPTGHARDGRVLAAFVLEPSPLEANARVVNGIANGGALALVAGQGDTLPQPLPGSGLIALKLPTQTSNFGGLIGNPAMAGRPGPRQVPEPKPLAATVAAASIFFDWGIKRQGDRKRTLLSLDGRLVEGLTQPLRISRA